MTLLNSLIPSLHRQPQAAQCCTPAAETQTVKPVYEIHETPEAWGLTAHLPGVAKEGLEITVDQQNVRILGRRNWKAPEGWSLLYRESSEAAFELVIEHDNAVDADKIHAELKNGVLNVSLPKAAAIKPRKISVG